MSFFNNIPVINNLPLGLRVGITRVIVAIAVFLIFWLLRHLVTKLLLRPLHDHFAKTENQTDDKLIEAFERFSGYVVVALGIYFGVLILELGDGTGAFFINLATTFIAIGAFRLLFDLGALVIMDPDRFKRLTHLELQPRMMPFIETAYRALIIAVAILLIAQIWNLNLTGIVAGLGLVGLAISLAAKEVLDDVVGFMVILADDVFRKDEYIISPKGQGIVENIGLRSTRIRGLDQSLIVVPNQALTSDAVVNWSRLEKRWFNFMIGVTYQTTIEQLEQVVDKIREMLKGRDAVDPDSVVVLFTEYGDSALNILIRSYVKISDWTEAHAERHAVNLEIKRICADLDVSIAYETHSLFVENIQPEWFAGAHLHRDGSNGSNGNGNGNHRDGAQDGAIDSDERGEVPDERYPGGDDDQVKQQEGEHHS